MQPESICSASRAVGRLFSKDGRLHLVLEVVPERGMARVSRRVGDATEVVELAVGEVMQRLGGAQPLKLDGLSSDATDRRLVERDEAWFFKAREGEHGPYPDAQSAQRALKRHILTAQEEGRTGRPAA